MFCCAVNCHQSMEKEGGDHNWGNFYINFILVSEHIDHYQAITICYDILLPQLDTDRGWDALDGKTNKH